MTTFAEVRREAISRMPYASAVLMNMTPIAHDEAPGLVADQNWNVYYNPKDLDLRSADNLCIEAIRLLQNHGPRLAQFIKESANHSFQQEIAQHCSNTLARALFSCDSEPLNGVPGVRYDHKHVPTIESYYRKVFDALVDKQPPQQSPQSSDSDDSDDGGQPRPKGLNPGPASGSAADGQPRPWEVPPKQQTQAQTGQQQQPQQGTQANIQAVRERVLKNIGTECGQTSMMNIATQADKQEKPVVRDLLSLLRQYAEVVCGYRVRRCDGRNRRQQQISEYNNQQMILSRDVGPKIELLLVLDTSGSMNQHIARRGMMYIASLLDSLNLSSVSAFYTGTTRPTYQGCLTRIAAEELYFDGNGGTDMGLVCRRAYWQELEQGGCPNILICVTDGETDYHGIEDIDIPFVVALVRDLDEYATVESLLGYCPIPDTAHLVDVDTT